MNSRKRLALAAVLSTTILLIGVALLALLTRTPPLEFRASTSVEHSSTPAENASTRVRSDWERESWLDGPPPLAGTLSPPGQDILGDEGVEALMSRRAPAVARKIQRAHESPEEVVISAMQAPQAIAYADISEPSARSSEALEAEVWIIAKAPQEEELIDAEDYIEDEHEDTPDPGSGALVANIPSADEGGDTEEVPLPLQHTAVDAAIAGHISTVRIKQQFANPFDTKIEAVYVFPLPENAAVTEFLMVIGERTIRGILREKEEAEAIYRAARDQGYQASLLVQRRPNIFEQKVANIEPGKAIDVDITYFSTLAYRDGWYSFVFPTVVGPRFNPPGHPDPVQALPRAGISLT